MINGDVKEIPLKGLSSFGNGYECTDGELQVCHNMVNDGLGLKPIQRVRVTNKLGKGWRGLVFVHHTSVGKIELFIDSSSNLLYGKDRTPIYPPANNIFVDKGFNISSVGNVLIVNFPKSNSVAAAAGTIGLHYYRYENGSYTYLGQRIPDINLQFSMVHYSGKEDTSGAVTYNDSYIVGVHKNQEVTHFRAPINFDTILSYSDAFDKYPQWVDQVLGAVNDVRAKARKHGLFTGRFFLRVAYRLYDGSYTMQSAPILMKPSDEMNPVVFPYYFSFNVRDENGNKYWDIDLKFKTLTKFYSLVVRSLLSAESKNELKRWRDIIDRVCIFVTPEIQEHKGSPDRMILKRKSKLFSRFDMYGLPIDDSKVEIIHGEQKPDGSTDDTVLSTLTAKDVLGKDMRGYGEPWKQGLYFPYSADMPCVIKKRLPPPAMYHKNSERYYIMANDNADSDTETKYVLRNMDKRAGLYNAAHFVIDNGQHINFDHIGDQDANTFIQLFKEFGCHYHTIEFERDGRSDEELMEQNYLFYLIKEYTLDEALAIGSDKSDVEMNFPEMEMNLSQDVWPGQNDVIKAPQGTSFVKIRENRLDTMQADTSTLPDGYSSLQNICPDMLHVYNGRLNVADVDITFDRFSPTWLQSDINNDSASKVVYARVVIETDGQTAEAVSSLPVAPDAVSSLWSGWLYFPHPDAKFFDIVYQSDNNFYTVRYPLKSHPFLHGAYFFVRDGYFMDFSPNLYSSLEDAVKSLPNASDKLSYPNRLLSSDVDNPFVFPAQGVNAVGAGRIVAIKSASKAISEGSAFGTMPLYVFTTDGIYPMSVGNDGLFSATNPPTRETLLNDSIDGALQIDNSILFLTERGLMMLVGQHTELLSGILSSSTVDCSVSNLPYWKRINDGFVAKGGSANVVNAGDFLSFINNGAKLAFDYVNYRAFVYRPYKADDVSTHVAYVYDMGVKSWATVDNTLTSSVEGFPGTIVNMVDADGNTVSGVFDKGRADFIGNGMALYISRPIKLGKPDILKTIRTLIERVQCSGNILHLALWGSRDLRKWNIIATGKDRILKVSGSPYNYFIVAGWIGFKGIGDGVSRLTIEEKDKHIDKLR